MDDLGNKGSYLVVLESMPDFLKSGKTQKAPPKILSLAGLQACSDFATARKLVRLSYELRDTTPEQSWKLISDFMDGEEAASTQAKAKLAVFFHQQLYDDAQLFRPEFLKLKMRLFEWMLDSGLTATEVDPWFLGWRILATLIDVASATCSPLVRLSRRRGPDRIEAELFQEGIWIPNGNLPNGLVNNFFGLMLLASSFPHGRLTTFLNLDLPLEFRSPRLVWDLPATYLIDFRPEEDIDLPFTPKDELCRIESLLEP